MHFQAVRFLLSILLAACLFPTACRDQNQAVSYWQNGEKEGMPALGANFHEQRWLKQYPG